ncbi:MAG TPA: lysophospholipid acyltransferase family protein [Chthoniobacterales bacterium]
MNADLFLVWATRLLVGAHASGTPSSTAQRIYFANHTSHLDAVTLWSALPPDFRAKTCPVAALDYWGANSFRLHVSTRLFHAVLLERKVRTGSDPLAPLREKLRSGQSLILFPEGTRRPQRLPATFKSGLYHLARAFPDIDLVPAYLNNLYRLMPKGSLLPVPLTTGVQFGQPLRLLAGETKPAFLERARQSVIALASTPPS